MRASILVKRGTPDDALAIVRDALDEHPDATVVLEAASTLAGAGARAQARLLLEEHLGRDQRIALELAGLMLQDGDIAGAGRIAAASLT